MIKAFTCLFIFLIIHPVRYFRLLSYCQKTKHNFIMDMVNFNYDVWCDDCGEVFSNEVR